MARLFWRQLRLGERFEKRSNSIEQKDIETAKARLKRVLEAEREEKKNVKQALRRR